MNAELSADELIALNRLTLVARLLAGTAHDVNNALQIVGGSVEMLARPQASPDAARTPWRGFRARRRVRPRRWTNCCTSPAT